jgi:hypothetical protein
MFGKPTYKCNLLLELADESTQALIAELEAIRDEFAEEKKKELTPAVIKKLDIKDVYTPDEDPETGEETGIAIFKAKQLATIENSKGETFKMSVSVVNSHGAPDKALNVFGGDIVKLCVTPAGYYSAKDKCIGVTLRLVAVQVIESNGGTGGDFGFGDEGDGAVGCPDGEPSDDAPEDFEDAGEANETDGDF